MEYSIFNMVIPQPDFLSNDWDQDGDQNVTDPDDDNDGVDDVESLASNGVIIEYLDKFAFGVSEDGNYIIDNLIVFKRNVVDYEEIATSKNIDNEEIKTKDISNDGVISF